TTSRPTRRATPAGAKTTAGSPVANESGAQAANPGASPGSLASGTSAANAGTLDGTHHGQRALAPTFDVAVGTYLNEARALAERTRLSENIAFPSRVVTAAEDTIPVYRVVVGPFGDRVAAERAASDLVQRGLVTEARVVAVAQPGRSQP